LNAGKHVLVEKPMALSLNDADKMIKLSREKNLKLGICHQNRFNSPIQKLRRAVEEGRFGRIINGTARILWNRNDDYYKQAPWRGTKALDGGTLMNQCIHNIDLLQWMMGSEVERVHCERGTFLRNIEMEDFGAILIRFKNGSIGIVEGSACVYPKNLEETLSIFGEKGTVVIGGLAVNKIKTWQFADERDYDKEDENTEIDSVYGRGHTPLYKNFIDAVNENKEPLINGEEGRKALKIILEAYEVCK
jgi:predicted dehydrogenase